MNTRTNARGAVVAFLTGLLFWTGAVPASRAAAQLEIQSVIADGRQIPVHSGSTIHLGSSAENVVFNFGAVTNSGWVPVRLRYKLEGYDNNWHEGNGEMSLNIRFFNHAGDQVAQKIYPVSGESPGWAGTLKNSVLTHRKESLVVPPMASQLWAIISSAGPPDAVGIYVVDDLVVTRVSSSNAPAQVLLRSPFVHGQTDYSFNQAPQGWIRDGIRPSMAKIVDLGPNGTGKAFAVMDDDPNGHAEWHPIKQYAPSVQPGDELEVDWNELYSTGAGNITTATYDKLQPGNYRFRVAAETAMGMPLDIEASVPVVVLQPIWKWPWFWVAASVFIIAASVASGRYYTWRRMRLEMSRLEHQRMLERERLRIAQDIHDDLGARATQISLVSAVAHGNSAFPEQARHDFDRISRMSRELVSALYETVWAVNPENDNLDALGNYLCQMVNQLTEQTPLRCRFDVRALPPNIQVSSHIRHNITMAVKEAVHNAIKHARASELNMHVDFVGDVLTISIRDGGVGFQPGGDFAGNGLPNMQRRLADIGGSCMVESSPGKGTTVNMRLPIPPAK